MTDNGKTRTLRFGFLTALEHAERGFVAGLLVTNQFGRPLEFQCTTPVKPNRTQQILYGPTLVPYVLGELAAQTLVKKAGVQPHLILTDNVDILELRNHVTIPVLRLVLPEAGSTEQATTATPADVDDQQVTRLGLHTCYTHASFSADRDAVAKLTSAMSKEADLSEPLERVQAALEEAVGFQAGAA
jgi:hypothetical protein